VSHRAPTSGSDRVGSRTGSIAVAAVDHHAGAVSRQQGRDGRTDAARPADHHGAALG
jgi:hypothetical protein